MEMVSIKLGNDQAYDEAVHGGLPENGDLLMVTKDAATQGGRPGVCLSFSVQLPDGSMRKAQVVITGRNFAMMAAAFQGRYGKDGDMVRTADQMN